MTKSLIYVPGLAMMSLVCKQVKSAQAFKDKISLAFEGDAYIIDMVETIINKGAIPTDCRQSLIWIEIPRAGEAVKGTAKALKILGRPSDNILSLEAGVAPKPMKMSVGVALKPCTAPEYIAQAMPSTVKTKALADIAKGDTLYIIGHSNALGGNLTYKCPALAHDKTICEGWQHCEKRHIDPVTLASLLINEGLPPGVKFDISLVACYSGGLETRELQTVQCFAQRLAGTLAGRGYICRVYGATGLTSSQMVDGKREVHAAKGATLKADGTISLNYINKDQLSDQPGQPFYRRFFRAFGGR